LYESPVIHVLRCDNISDYLIQVMRAMLVMLKMMLQHLLPLLELAAPSDFLYCRRHYWTSG